MRRTSLNDADCPVARALDAVGDWWSLLIVRDAMFGLRRFGEFQKSLGMAKNILTTRLRDLVAAGILDTVPATDGGAYKEYVLTQKGRDLFPVLVALRQWGETHQFPTGACRIELLDREKAEPVRPLELRAADGRLLSDADTMIRLRN
ncbi:helix-turn-helix transcriptional regulator [Ferrovibrio terrae]|uniref:Helix-turn-helix transcriptional regulator n=1 Tax=Ferrovibrio terrae TaxID=2594003 RepID=A0A516H5K4_9PROT|nr:helix-turn-helix domain-containing protein [Ferrovibrio terrae]QDO99027.1 helix-turn-helix transcriptional regulator [Ferrovibrio terrae]